MHLYCHDYGWAGIEVSKDDGSHWSRVYGEVKGRIDTAWKRYELELDASYATNKFRVRFNMRRNVFDLWGDDPVDRLGWYVDDVAVVEKGCAMVPGGIVTGRVIDANTGLGVNGATVASSDSPGDRTTTFSSPDENQGSGLYVLFSPLTGERKFVASRGRYLDDAGIATVVPNAVTVRNFSLRAALLSVDPAQMQAQICESGARTLSITNSGSAEAVVRLSDVAIGGVMTPGGVGSAAVMPSGRFHAASATCDGIDMYVFGGYAGDDPTKDVYRYSRVTNTWTPMGSMPVAKGLSKMQAVCIGGVIYIAGGTDDRAHLGTF
ncbi:MAG: kelch repeat-containing protein, partial [Myxococcota bacterium]